LSVSQPDAWGLRQEVVLLQDVDGLQQTCSSATEKKSLLCEVHWYYPSEELALLVPELLQMSGMYLAQKREAAIWFIEVK